MLSNRANRDFPMPKPNKVAEKPKPAAKPGERDYPINDPRAPDFDGSDYMATQSPYERDYPAGHPSAADSDENIEQSRRDRIERGMEE